jgi:uncharacterized membrane protein
MDALVVISVVLRIFFGFLLVLLLPGFTLLMVIFPRKTDLSIIERLVYSTVLSIGSVIVLVLFMEFVLGVNISPRNITLFSCVFCEIALGFWWCERWYQKSKLKTHLNLLIYKDYGVLWNYSISVMDSIRNWFMRKFDKIRKNI